MNDPDEILKPALRDDESLELALAEKLKQKQKTLRKKRSRWIYAGLLLLFFVWIWRFLFAPFQLSLPYGVCKSFLELNVSYPHTVYVSEADTRMDGSIQIWFTHTDPFGEFRMESFHCFYNIDAETNVMTFSKIKLGKVELDQKTIDSYNKVLPFVASMPIDLTYPKPLPDTIEDLQIDIDAARRINLKSIVKR